MNSDIRGHAGVNGKKRLETQKRGGNGKGRDGNGKSRDAVGRERDTHVAITGIYGTNRGAIEPRFNYVSLRTHYDSCRINAASATYLPAMSRMFPRFFL